MKTIAVDPGAVHIGIAISDENGTIARPLAIVQHVSRQEDARKIITLALENGCEIIVVGVPLDSQGNIGPRARTSIRLIQAIKELTDLPVKPWDESGSSKQVESAQTAMKLSKKRRARPKDDQAAAVILADYLESIISENAINHE
ncbi:MAG: Holliday junction resolvase RuvX [Anaerolineaceae bacterium]